MVVECDSACMVIAFIVAYAKWRHTQASKFIIMSQSTGLTGTAHLAAWKFQALSLDTVAHDSDGQHAGLEPSERSQTATSESEAAAGQWQVFFKCLKHLQSTPACCRQAKLESLASPHVVVKFEAAAAGAWAHQ